MEKQRSISSAVIIASGLVFLGLCLVFAANTMKPKAEERYQIVALNTTNFAVIDRQTHKIFYKFIRPDGGPVDWTEIVMPQ